MKKVINNKTIYYLLAGYFILSLLVLTTFPYMHSDESWLSGLSRSIMKSGYSSTEYFFDLYPRYPHAIKILFHSIQILFISVFGYSLFSIRLISLLVGVCSLYLFYKILLKLFNEVSVAILSTLILAFDVQFIYASHFGRQEIFMIAFLLGALLFILEHIEKWSYKKDIVVAILIGLSIGFHPNSFIVSLMIGSVYIYFYIKGKLTFKNIMILVSIVFMMALFFVGISFILDPDFINHYLFYGDNMGVTKTGLMKFLYFDDYYKLLFNQDSVTYYMPPIQLQLILFSLGAVIAVLRGFKENVNWLFALMLIAFNVGIIAIGRYSQPGIVLMFPIAYLLLFGAFKKQRIIVLLVVFTLVFSNTIVEVKKVNNDDYYQYTTSVRSHIPEGSTVFANLNLEFEMEYGKFYDYRNFEYMEVSFEDYVESNEIDYIVYSEELDFIYDRRPTWNFLYGNLFPIYDEMQTFLSRCELIATLENPYAMRILAINDIKEWKIKIYKVKR